MATSPVSAPAQSLTVKVNDPFMPSRSAGSPADRDGMNGSFTFTVKLWAGADTGDVATSTYASVTAKAAGVIAATPYNKWAVTVSTTTGGAVSGGGAFEEGSTVTVTAAPNDGYRFVCWQENGETVSTEAAYAFELTGDRSLTAVFERTPSGDGGDGGSGSGGSEGDGTGGDSVNGGGNSSGGSSVNGGGSGSGGDSGTGSDKGANVNDGASGASSSDAALPETSDAASPLALAVAGAAAACTAAAVLGFRRRRQS